MKVGFRLSECIHDIAHGVVKFEDVAFIVSLTAIQPERDLSEIIDNWINSTLLDAEHRSQYIDVLVHLFKYNKVLQPKLQGLGDHWRPTHSECWMDLYPSAPPKNSAVQSAWDNYRIVSALS